ncbi:hypothetical protein [Leucobacter sp. NPDC077196]|uniref:hypothetical protein n=1 Tax=Leucobacter sp. NPDC077196 TaxID=3154959 RepID=UPI00341AD22B
MLSVGGSILIAVTTALVTIGLNELVRWLRERAAARKLRADWSVAWVGKDPRARTRVAVVENIGHVEAHNVNITITGDSDFEIHPDAPLHKARPNDAILVMVDSPGTGIYRIDWTDAKGVDQGPVFRFPTIT